MGHRNSSVFSANSLTGAVLLALALGPQGLTAAHAANEKPKSPPPAGDGKRQGASKGAITEIQVTLFGQPCLMNGPFPQATLTLIHEISPEKIPPTASIDAMKKIRAKAVQLKNVPMPIEQYREHLRKRLSAKIAFEEALAPAKKTTNPAESKRALETFLKNLKEHISTLQFPGFSDSAKKSLEANSFQWNDAFIQPLREKYEDVIQPETQEEFHKAIRLSQIQYVCSFDEGEDHSHDAEEE